MSEGVPNGGLYQEITWMCFTPERPFNKSGCFISLQDHILQAMFTGLPRPATETSKMVSISRDLTKGHWTKMSRKSTNIF